LEDFPITFQSTCSQFDRCFQAWEGDSYVDGPAFSVPPNGNAKCHLYYSAIEFDGINVLFIVHFTLYIWPDEGQFQQNKVVVFCRKWDGLRFSDVEQGERLYPSDGHSVSRVVFFSKQTDKYQIE
jgi:hypothetical protein